MNVPSGAGEVDCPVSENLCKKLCPKPQSAGAAEALDAQHSSLPDGGVVGSQEDGDSGRGEGGQPGA